MLNYAHCWEMMKVSGRPYQLGIVIQDESDGLILPDTSKVVSYDQCCLVLGFDENLL
jgi:hypothetical protein